MCLQEEFLTPHNLTPPPPAACRCLASAAACPLPSPAPHLITHLPNPGENRRWTAYACKPPASWGLFVKPCCAGAVLDWTCRLTTTCIATHHARLPSYLTCLPAATPAPAACLLPWTWWTPPPCMAVTWHGYFCHLPDRAYHPPGWTYRVPPPPTDLLLDYLRRSAVAFCPLHTAQAAGSAAFMPTSHPNCMPAYPAPCTLPATTTTVDDCHHWIPHMPDRQALSYPISQAANACHHYPLPTYYYHYHLALQGQGAGCCSSSSSTGHGLLAFCALTTHG